MFTTLRHRAIRILGLVAFILAGASRPDPGVAQGLLPGMGGAGAGLAVGGVAAAGYITARAHFADDYLDGYHDLVPVPAALVSAGLVSGIVLGTTDADALARASLGALLLGAGGTAMGILAGRELLDAETGPWAGALLGGGAGAALGWILGAWLGRDGDGGAPATNFAVRIPLPGPGRTP